MTDFNSLSSNQRFALNVFIPLLYFLPLAVAWFSPKHFAFGHPHLVLPALTVAGAGLILWISATFFLGKSLAVLPGADTLKTRGVYRFIRHPIYLGINLTLLGLLFACGSAFGMVYWLIVVIPLNVYRARREEKALREKFGDAYRTYRQKTWF